MVISLEINKTHATLISKKKKENLERLMTVDQTVHIKITS